MHDKTKNNSLGDGGSSIANAGVQQAVPPLITFPLCDSHRVNDFCAAKSPAVEDFLKAKAADQIQRNFCRVFVLQNPDDATHIWGYYTLSAFQIERDSMGRKHADKLGRRTAPMVLLGYMGKADGMQNGMGLWLIADAARRVATVREHLGIWGLAVEAENDALGKWYSKPEIGFFMAKTRFAPERPFLYAPLVAFLPELQAAQT